MPSEGRQWFRSKVPRICGATSMLPFLLWVHFAPARRIRCNQSWWFHSSSGGWMPWRYRPLLLHSYCFLSAWEKIKSLFVGSFRRNRRFGRLIWFVSLWRALALKEWCLLGEGMCFWERHEKIPFLVKVLQFWEWISQSKSFLSVVGGGSGRF